MNNWQPRLYPRYLSTTNIQSSCDGSKGSQKSNLRRILASIRANDLANSISGHVEPSATYSEHELIGGEHNKKEGARGMNNRGPLFKFKDLPGSWHKYLLTPIGHLTYPKNIGFDGQIFFRKNSSR